MAAGEDPDEMRAEALRAFAYQPSERGRRLFGAVAAGDLARTERLLGQGALMVWTNLCRPLLLPLFV